jgi:putative Holliday junction resolvase
MPEPRALTLLAFDFGFKRIGVAVGDTVTAGAVPCAAVRGDVRAAAGSAGPDWEAIERQIRAVGPQRLVVGAPYNEDGGSTPMTAAARKFAKELALRFALPVSCVDERYSSLEAAAALKARRASGARKRRVTREAIDSVSAALILERWLAGEGRELEDLDTEQ